jgi:UDP-N-acetylglucosamine 2-epimerase (non-hydrolysing)
MQTREVLATCANIAIESNDRITLVTGHRRESFGEGLRNVCMALLRMAEKHPHVHIPYPVHPNQNVSIPMEELLGKTRNGYLLEPLDYRSPV